MKTSKAKIRIWCAVLLVLILSTVASVKAPAESWKQIIVKCSPEDLDRVRAGVGGAIVQAFPGHYLLTVPSSADIRAVESIHGKGPIEASENLPLYIAPRPAQTASTTSSSLPLLLGPVTYYGAPARQGYTDQWAVAKIRLKEALNVAHGAGLGIKVAVIDTGVDEQNPTLKGALLPGKNYVGRTSNPSELDDYAVFAAQSSAAVLEQSSAAVLEQSSAAVLEQSSAAVLEQSSAAVLEQYQLRYLPSYLGHGTGMIGLAFLVAPQAKFIPLKAFNANGAASQFDVVHAIYDAVDVMQVDVINMSWVITENSKILADAVRYAASKGVVLIGAAGNSNTDAPTFPASLEGTVGVCATDLNDQKAPFSNYGPDVDVCSPGVNLITPFLGSHWQMVSGTSGAAAMVSGLAALVKQQAGTQGQTVRERIEHSAVRLKGPSQYRDELGKGRIDAYGAVSSRSGDHNN